MENSRRRFHRRPPVSLPGWSLLIFSILHSPRRPQRGITPFSMQKLSYWLLFFLVLHSPTSEKVWQPLLMKSNSCELPPPEGDNSPWTKRLFIPACVLKNPAFISMKYLDIEEGEIALCKFSLNPSLLHSTHIH